MRDIQPGCVLKLKKQHPCGSNEWLVYRTGADIGIKCLGCGRRLMLPRSKIESRIVEQI